MIPGALREAEVAPAFRPALSQAIHVAGRPGPFRVCPGGIKVGRVASTLKILVVDDNPKILKLVCQSLEKCGELFTATDGSDALMKAIEIKPDLIISDYSMPVMDGRALFDKLRARPETQDIPFVFLASQKEIDERLRMVVEGVEEYFVKPFFLRDLCQQARRTTARLLQQRVEKEGGGAGIKGQLDRKSVV